MVKCTPTGFRRTIGNGNRQWKQTLVICGIFSCLIFFLIFFDQSITMNLLNSTKVRFKSIIKFQTTLLSDYVESQTTSISDYTHLMDLRFTFKILPLVCSERTETLLILVHSATDHFNSRKIIRGTWGQYDNAKVLFLVGEAEKEFTQNKLDEESMLYKDILQGSFLDSYHNLTYKHVMALKYAVYHCPKAQFVLKVDDDVFVNIPALKIFLTSYTCQKKRPKKILCSRLFNPGVLRVGKWGVSLEDYPERTYPTHCGGFAILYPQDVIYALYTTAQRTKFFWIDDVFVSGICAKKANVTHIGIEKLIILRRDIHRVVNRSSTNYNKPFLIGGINLNENQIRILWNFATHYVPKTMLDYLLYD